MVRHYLPCNIDDNKPVFKSGRDIYDLTKHNRIDKIIWARAGKVMKKSNIDYNHVRSFSGATKKQIISIDLHGNATRANSRRSK